MTQVIVRLQIRNSVAWKFTNCQTCAANVSQKYSEMSKRHSMALKSTQSHIVAQMLYKKKRQFMNWNHSSRRVNSTSKRQAASSMKPLLLVFFRPFRAGSDAPHNKPAKWSSDTISRQPWPHIEFLGLKWQPWLQIEFLGLKWQPWLQIEFLDIKWQPWTKIEFLGIYW